MSPQPEKVHTMTAYYDGPRGGIANYQGQPHVYDSLWAEKSGCWTDLFMLMPIDEETLQLALEDWAIWLRWKQTFDEDRTSLQTHPVLPEDRERHETITNILGARLQVIPENSIIVAGQFEVVASSLADDKHNPVLVVFWGALQSPLELFVQSSKM